MKKRAVWFLAAALVLVSGCGGRTDGGEAGAAAPTVSLESLYAGMAENCGWEEDYMTGVEGGLLEEYYPGLSEVPAKQLIVQVPAMSSDVNEIVLIQCETEKPPPPSSRPASIARWRAGPGTPRPRPPGRKPRCCARGPTPRSSPRGSSRRAWRSSSTSNFREESVPWFSAA